MVDWDQLFDDALLAEVDEYLTMSMRTIFDASAGPVPASKAVPVFWNHGIVRQKLPVLRIMARRYCMMPATSAAVERMFSACSLYTGRRGRHALDSDTLFMQVMLYMNNKYRDGIIGAI